MKSSTHCRYRPPSLLKGFISAVLVPWRVDSCDTEVELCGCYLLYMYGKIIEVRVRCSTGIAVDKVIDNSRSVSYLHPTMYYLHNEQPSCSHPFGALIGVSARGVRTVCWRFYHSSP